MDWLQIAGAVFLTWLVLVFLFTPHIDNVGVRDTTVAARLMEDYVRDLQDSREVTLPAWQQRPWREKVAGPFVWILERQQ